MTKHHIVDCRGYLVWVFFKYEKNTKSDSSQVKGYHGLADTDRQSVCSSKSISLRIPLEADQFASLGRTKTDLVSGIQDPFAHSSQSLR